MGVPKSRDGQQRACGTQFVGVGIGQREVAGVGGPSG